PAHPGRGRRPGYGWRGAFRPDRRVAPVQPRVRRRVRHHGWPAHEAWGFFRGGGRVPGSDELAELRGRVGYTHVVLDASQKTIRFDRPGVELDLGGIAKGYAVDRVVGLLREHGVVAALVSAGGGTVVRLAAAPGQPT